MFTTQDAQNRLAAMKIAAKVKARGSGTFNITVDLGTDNHQEAYKASAPIWKALEAAGMITTLGGHVGDHDDGYQTLEATITLNPPEPKEPFIGYCPTCGGSLLHYSSGWTQCSKCDFSLKDS
jgi:hypothetical protein